jgi:uncharacterized protein YbjT (DUF2867 family)
VTVFVTGATGYLGRPLVASLAARGHHVRALTRRPSRSGLPDGCEPVAGNALDADTFAFAVGGCDTFVHLVGTPRPNPSKAREFETVDLASVEAAVTAARRAGVGHFVYVSVAHPAPVMQAYIAVRRRGEALVRDLDIPATILRPWYVLGPGHWWPYALVPMYALLRRLPGTAAGAARLALVTRRDMVASLVRAVEHPPPGVAIIQADEISGSNRLDAEREPIGSPT